MNDIQSFFNRFIEQSHRDSNARYVDVYHFELNEYWANELLRLVLIGQKKATASSYDSFKLGNETLPKKGDLNIITDFAGNPRCVVETKQITILPFKDFTYEIVKREGEDDNLESWQQGHIRFFTAEGKALGYTFSEDMLVVFEDFEVVYQE
ncbi:ASCH domain-containing protein [Paracholeplasma manati]|uniref:ASCH domain-containing protein n=1 Tax=Paracholeplasma manati TaxID=591373 RepID=A0ABT2YB82_9MOLU|nr:ASCH domain-containing protein [Paracholeplasma manati]MCV2231273.1 ASCH domain-containing protein [Paracholeplasma manati]MDG0888351.1 ASCH domain-containing protein [Paracholeplasma manati]